VLRVELAYSGGRNLYKDNGSGEYTAPHYSRYATNTPVAKPYLYVANSPLSIEYIKIYVSGLPSNPPTIALRGLVDGFQVQGTAVVTPVVSGVVMLSLSNVNSNPVAFAYKTHYTDKFKIQWEIKIGEGNWSSLATTSTPLFVSLSDPSGLGVNLFYTVAFLAAAWGGAENESTAVINTWSMFAAPGGAPANTKGYNELTQDFTKKLYYYKPSTNLEANTAVSAAGLLQSPLSTGQCGSWASLLRCALYVNGVSTKFIKAESNIEEYNWLLVKDWHFGQPSPIVAPGTWLFEFDNTTYDMVPIPPQGKYGDLTNIATLYGQNSSPNSPSQKAFVNHQFVKVIFQDGSYAYLDPSYGTQYSDEFDFQKKAIAAFGKEISPSPTNQHKRLQVFPAPDHNHIVFHEAQ
jgi:hypothetical protein